MAYENFQNDYTEVDALGRLALATVKITATDLDQNETAYVYKDFTASYFNAIDCDFEGYVQLDQLYGWMTVAGFTNTVGNNNDWATTDLSCALSNHTSGAGKTWIWIQRGPTTASDYWDGGTIATLYYMTMERAAANDTATCKIYTDSARTSLSDTLSLAGLGTATRWRYAYGASSLNSGTSGRDFTGYVQNVDLNEVIRRRAAFFKFF